MERALIIGCGYTGEALARRLLPAGIPVFGTSLSGRVIAGDLTGVQMRAVDLKSTEQLEFAESNGAVVYYMVSTLCRVHDPAARPHMAPLEAGLAGLERHDVQALIYLSSTSVYGDTRGAWVDEQTPPAPCSPWGKMRLELERRVDAWGRQRQVPTCVVRLPEIYGPGRGPVQRLRSGGYTLRFPERLSNRIHVHDLARVLERLGQRPDQRLLLVADGNPATTEEVYGHAAALLGLGPIPHGELVTEDENRRALLSESKRCSNRRLLRWLGEDLRYPTFRQGLPTTV